MLLNQQTPELRLQMEFEWVQNKADLIVMEGESFSELDDIRVNVNIVYDVGDDPILLGEFALIVEQLLAFFECQFEVPDDVGKWRQVVGWGPKNPNAVVFQSIIGSGNDGFNGFEVGVKAV
jgi:hypothetical protein